MTISNLTRQTQIADKAVLAQTMFSRMRGLLAKDTFCAGEALILQPADSLHTFFMRFPIDVIFLDGKDKVLKISENFSPFRFCLAPRGAARVIELPVNTIRNSSTKIGDILKIS